MWSRSTLVDQRAVGIEDIDRIEPAAEADFEYRNVDACFAQTTSIAASVPNSK